MARSIGDAFLGGMTLAQQANQSRFENQYRNRVLDLDNRALAERKRQFDLAYKSDQDAQELAERQQTEIERANPINERNMANRTKVLKQNADTQDRRLDFDIDVEENTRRKRLETNRLGQLLPFMNADFTTLGDRFFERTPDGKLVNRNQIIDLINTDSALLISEFAPGQYKDKEVAGFDYDRESGNTRVLLRDKLSDGEVAPATVNGTNASDDAVIELAPEQFRDYVRRRFQNETLANHDNNEINLPQGRAMNLLGQAAIGRQEALIEQAVEAKIMAQGNVGMMRQAKQLLAETQDDPTARAELLKSFGLDASQFGPEPDTRDPSSEFLGPDQPLKDPLLSRFGGGSDAFAGMVGSRSGGTNPFMGTGDKGQFTTKYPNLVSELQSNFNEESNLQSNARLTTQDRKSQLQGVQERRQELLDNIGPEIAARKTARANYSRYLDGRKMSQPQREKLLGEYDAYIAQLETYIPEQEKVVVDVATELGRLADMGEEELKAGFDNGTLPITPEQINGIQQFLIERDVRNQTDLMRQSLTTQFAAHAAIAATSQDPSTRKAAYDAANNLSDTGFLTLNKNQLLQAQDAAEDNRRAERERVDERNDKVTDSQKDIREAIQTNVVPLAEELSNEFAVTKEIDLENASGEKLKQIQEMGLGKRPPLRQRVVQTWTNGAGSKALRGLRDASKSKSERDAFGGVFNSAVTTSIAALVSRNKDAGFDFQDVFETVFDESIDMGGTSRIMQTAQDIGLADSPMSDANVRTTEEGFGTLEVQTDNDNVPTIYRVKNPEGGVYRGQVTATELRRVLGETAYSVFQDQLVKAGKIPAQN